MTINALRKMIQATLTAAAVAGGSIKGFENEILAFAAKRRSSRSPCHLTRLYCTKCASITLLACTFNFFSLPAPQPVLVAFLYRP